MKVSVIVPVYNAEEYLRECLESLKRQTLKDIEIICVDNASTDNSRDIITEYCEKDSRFRFLFHEDNQGQGMSLIEGLKMAQGEYVAECDADDYVAGSIYETLYRFAKKWHLQVAQCGWFDVYGNIKKERLMAISATVFNHRNLDRKQKMGFLGAQPHMMSAIYKTEWIRENGLWYRPDKNYEDTSLCFKIRTAAERYGILPLALYFYRRDNMQAGSYTVKDPYGVMEQYKEINRFNKEHNLFLDDFIGVNKFYTYRWQRKRLTGADRETFIANARKDFANDTVDPDLFIDENDRKDYFAWRFGPEE